MRVNISGLELGETADVRGLEPCTPACGLECMSSPNSAPEARTNAEITAVSANSNHAPDVGHFVLIRFGSVLKIPGRCVHRSGRCVSAPRVRTSAVLRAARELPGRRAPPTRRLRARASSPFYAQIHAARSGDFCQSVTHSCVEQCMAESLFALDPRLSVGRAILSSFAPSPPERWRSPAPLALHGRSAQTQSPPRQRLLNSPYASPTLSTLIILYSPEINSTPVCR